MSAPAKLSFVVTGGLGLASSTVCRHFLARGGYRVVNLETLTYACVADLHAAVGYRPATPIREGIAQFVAWYRWYYECW